MAGKFVAKVNVLFGANIKGFSTQMQNVTRQMAKTGRQMAKVGQSMTMGITAPLTLLGGTAFKTFADFEQEMAKVKAISGATSSEFALLEQNAKKLGASTKYTASQFAELQLNYAKIGFNPQEILAVTNATQNLANATGEDLARSAEVAGATLRGFGLEADQMGAVTDIMAKSFSSSALDLDRFGESMKYVAPVAKSAGVSLNEVTAMLSVMADAGIHGSMAGTSLKRILSEVAATGKPLNQALAEMSEKGIDLAGAQDEVGRSAQASLLVLADNTSKINELKGSYENAGGSASKMASIMDNTSQGEMARLQSAFEGVQIAIGQLLSKYIRPLMVGIQNLLSNFTALDSGTQDMIVTIGLIAAAIGPLIMGFGKIMTLAPKIASAFTLMTGPIGLTVTAIAGVAWVFYKMWDEIKPIIVKISNGFIDLYNQSAVFRGGVEILRTTFKNVITQMTAVFEVGKAGFSALWEAIKDPVNFGDIMTNAFSEIKEITVSAGEEIGNNVKEGIENTLNGHIDYITEEDIDNAVSKASDLVSQVKEKISSSFSLGGTGGGATADATSTNTNLSQQSTSLGEGDFNSIYDDLVSLDEELAEPISNISSKMEQMQAVGQAVGNEMSNAFSNMGSSLVSSLDLADTGMGRFAKGMIGTVTKLIAMMLSQSIATSIAGATESGLATGPGAVFATPGFIATAVGGVLSAFAAIPKFADGGIISGTTLGIMGEYPGASSNPEVIAPLDKLKSLIGGDGQSGGRVTFQIEGDTLIGVLDNANYRKDRLG